MPKMVDIELMTFAQDLTKIALEHNLIPNDLNNSYVDTPEGMAECVANYYKTLLKKLNPEE